MDIIAALVIAVVVIISVVFTVKRFRKGGSCCDR